jgi:histidyl-tRNA synthetase
MSESCSKKSQVQLYVVPIKAQKECIPLIQELRTAGIRVDSDMKGKGVSKNLQFANYYEIPFVLIVGEDELKSGKYTLRDMKSGEESKVSIAKCVKDVLANQ